MWVDRRSGVGESKIEAKDRKPPTSLPGRRGDDQTKLTVNFLPQRRRIKPVHKHVVDLCKKI